MPEYTFDYDDFNFRLSIPPYWSEIYRGKPREPLYKEYTAMLNKLKTISTDKVVLDVGVNHGIFSIPAAMLGYTVVGFEPVEDNFDSVLRSININNVNTLDVYNIALSNESKDMEIYVPECPDNSSFSKEAAVANMKGKGFRTEVVTAMRFDEWITHKPEYKNVGFIKIDTQGSEYNIIEGMEEFLSEASDIYLLCEYEDHLIKMGRTYEELDTLITSLGFMQEGKIANDKVFYKP